MEWTPKGKGGGHDVMQAPNRISKPEKKNMEDPYRVDRKPISLRVIDTEKDQVEGYWNLIEKEFFDYQKYLEAMNNYWEEKREQE